MIRNIFIDLDDTILDFHKGEQIALSDTLRSLGIEPTEAVLKRYREINRSLWAALERGELSRYEVLHKRFEILFKELSVDIKRERAQSEYEYRLSLEHPFIEGGQDLLDALFGKYRLYIASNGTAYVQDRRIADAKLAKYFDGIFISERVGYDKPSKEFFDVAFSQIPNFKKDETIFLGDSLTSDIKGAENAGILSCYFNRYGLKNDTGTVPSYEISNLLDFLKILEEL
jgi:2-haloacid dehalogenase